MSSTEFDSYLYLYQADGTLITENDDASDASVSAGLQIQMIPVCYRIEVTSFGDGETGAYTARID